METGFALWLSRRQIACVLRHRGTVPAAFAAAVTTEQHQRAADYTVARERLAMAQRAAMAALNAALLLGGLDLIYGVLAAAFPASIELSTGFVLAVNAVTEAAALPFAVWSTFVVERRFGFNRTTLRTFMVDRLKGAALELLLNTPLLLACFWVMRHASGWWWLWTWAGLVVAAGALAWAYPRFLAPLFNTFAPLPQGELRTRVERLMARCGFRASGLFTMDASRRSAHGNAYFTGIGRTKRIVLFDTLIARHPADELEAVLAHELGHFAHHHGLWRMVWLAGTAFCVLWGFGWLTRQGWLLPALGIAHADNALRLYACLLLAGVLGPVGTVLGNWISRRNEFQADAYARDHIGAKPLVAALLRLTRDNAGTLTPDPLYALVHYSHPPVPTRVRQLGGQG